MAISPLLLGDIMTLVRENAVAACVAAGDLTEMLLIGENPSEDATWKYRTRLNLVPNPPQLEKANLSLDMACWPLKKRTLGLFSCTVRIGRAPSNDVVLTHADVSKLHARLDVATGLLTDAASANGTFVNGVRLAPEKPHALKEGDLMTFGRVSIHYFPLSMLVPLLRPGRR